MTGLVFFLSEDITALGGIKESTIIPKSFTEPIETELFSVADLYKEAFPELIIINKGRTLFDMKKFQKEFPNIRLIFPVLFDEVYYGIEYTSEQMDKKLEEMQETLEKFISKELESQLPKLLTQKIKESVELDDYAKETKKSIELELSNIDVPKKLVGQYGKDGKLVEIFNDVKKAHKKTRVSKDGIYKAMKGERKTAGGFYWKNI